MSHTFVFFVRDRVSGNFVASAMHFLNGRVVGVLVRHEECGFDRAAVRIVASFLLRNNTSLMQLSTYYLRCPNLKQSLVDVNVVVVDRIVEGQHDHLRNRVGLQFARNLRAVRRTEAVRQHTLRLVTRRCSVRVLVDG